MPKSCVATLKTVLSTKSQQLKYLMSAFFKYFKIVQKTSFPTFFQFEMALLKTVLKVKMLDIHFKEVCIPFFTFQPALKSLTSQLQ